LLNRSYYRAANGSFIEVASDMKGSQRFIPLLAVAVIALQACSRDPAVVKEESFKKANAHVSQGNYSEAILEYRTALQADPKFGAARYKLAQAYAHVGDVASAYREYVRAADLLPDDTEAQISAGTILLLAGQFEDARTRALNVLEKNPKNTQAMVLLGNALGGLKQYDAAIEKLEEAVQIKDGAEALSSLGLVELARGAKPEAEAAFRRAIAAEPNSAQPHVALANYLLSVNRTEEAERAMRDALALAPADPMANRALAVYLLRVNRAKEAEPYIKAVADVDDTPEATHKLALADYYLGLDRWDDAERILEPLRRKATTFVAATSRMAVLEYARKHTDAAHKLIAEALAKSPNDVPTLLTKARFLETETKYREALDAAKSAVSVEADNIQVRFTLGNIYKALGQRSEAITEYNHVLRLNPNASTAHLELSRLELEQGDVASALSFAEAGVRIRPESGPLQLALARALVAKGDLARADVILKRLVTSAPDSSAVHSTRGMLAASRRDWATARNAFERALKLDERNAEAFSGLIGVELADGKADAAKARISDHLARHPDDASALMASARAYLTLKDSDKAEEALQRAVNLNTADFSAYATLAQLLVAKGEADQAIERFQALLARDPRSAGGHTFIGMLLQLKGRPDEARVHYEKALEVDPHAAVAANNLAVIYVDKGENLDVALQLAQTAKQSMPDHPSVNDTLGWIYQRKGLSNLAVPFLRSAVKTNPKNPDYQYHLGMALVGIGEKAPAKAALEQALALNSSFDGAAEARSVLASWR
jgi:tetratricopeptide (TPR) repeat protein